MPVTDQHPDYERLAPEWQLMSDAIEGERAIKGGGVAYLPKTSGMIEAEALAAKGQDTEAARHVRQLYASYLDQAQYPLWVKDSLRTMMGMVSRLEPQVSLPSGLADLETDATSDGFSAKQLFMRICRDLLIKGRMPLLCDFDDDLRPYVATYRAEDGINWRVESVRGRNDLTLAVLRECIKKDAEDEFNHETETVYRVLDLFEGRYRVRLLDENGELIREEHPGLANAGAERGLPFIPLVFAGSTDNNPAVDEIPLLTMAKAALKYYRLSADYYQSLHHTAHPQPVVTGLGGDDDLRVTGPMAAWTLPEGAEAFYLEFSGAGIEKTREAMLDQRNAALEAGARVIDVRAQESGDARRARQDDQHATLHSVVMQAAEAVEQCFRYIALWRGLPAEEVIFTVEPKFTKDEIDSALMQIVGNLVLAGEVPRTVLYGVLRKAGLTELSDDDLEALHDVGQLPGLEDVA